MESSERNIRKIKKGKAERKEKQLPSARRLSSLKCFAAGASSSTPLAGRLAPALAMTPTPVSATLSPKHDSTNLQFRSFSTIYPSKQYLCSAYREIKA